MSMSQKGFAGLLLACIAASVVAVEPGWYGPGDGSGRGLLVHCQDGGSCGFAWFDHGDGSRQVWLTGAESCQRGEVCATDLLRPTADGFGGIGGPVDLGLPVGDVLIEPMDGAIRISWLAIVSGRCVDDGGAPLGTSGLWSGGCLRTDQVWPLIVGDGQRSRR